MKHIRIAAALALTAALSAGTARAQVYTPPFMSPTPTSDFGVYVSDLGDVAIEGIWRRLSAADRALVTAPFVAGADGVAIGGLLSDGTIDTELTRSLVDEARDLHDAEPRGAVGPIGGPVDLAEAC